MSDCRCLSVCLPAYLFICLSACWPVCSFKFITFQGPASFCNAEQSKFPREIYSGRTLAIQGDQHVPGQVQSENALTHSCTTEPTISADAELLPKLLVCIQETNGESGIRVTEIMFKASNIHAMASSSERYTKVLTV